MSSETYEWLNTQILVGFTDPQYGRGNAWHFRANLQGAESNHYSGAIPVEDVIRRLYNWEVTDAPVFIGIKDSDGNIIDYVEDPTRKAIIRDDTNDIFSIFKSSYQEHSYKKWLLDTVANIIDDSNLQIGGAGLLKGGAKSYCQVELPESIKIDSVGMSIRPHLLACTSHDGTLSTTYKTVATIVVCDNTLAGALGESTTQHKVRHSKNSIGRLQNVRDALGIVHEFSDDLIAEIERLSCQVVTDNEFQAIVERLVPVSLDMDIRPQVQARIKNKQDLLRSIYKEDDRVKEWTGTALGVLQTWNTYQHWFAGSDGAKRAERNMLNGILSKTEDSDRQVLTLINQLVGV